MGTPEMYMRYSNVFDKIYHVPYKCSPSKGWRCRVVDHKTSPAILGPTVKLTCLDCMDRDFKPPSSVLTSTIEPSHCGTHRLKRLDCSTCMAPDTMGRLHDPTGWWWPNFWGRRKIYDPTKITDMLADAFDKNVKYIEGNKTLNSLESVDTDLRVDCPICIGKVVDPIRVNVCSHVFCTTCIRAWMVYHSTCPLCRTVIN